MADYTVYEAVRAAPTGGIPYGMKGTGVTALQLSLNALLGNVVKVDGDYGANTEEAVQQAYARLKVAPASGVASSALLSALAAATGPGGEAGAKLPPSDKPAPGGGGDSSVGKIAAVALGVLGLGWFLSKKR